MTLTLSGYDEKLGKLVEYEVEGRKLSTATSHRDEHVYLVHDVEEFAKAGERCPACRWFEVHIYALEDGTWAVETVGESIVPDEVTKRQVWFCDTPRRVVAVLVQHRGGDYFIPSTSRRALDDAAEADERLAPVIDTALDLSDAEALRT